VVAWREMRRSIEQFLRTRGHPTVFHLLSEDRLREATDDQDYFLDDYSKANYRLAREVGQKAGADFVYIVNRNRSASICTLTHYLVNVNDSQEVFQVEVDSFNSEDYMDDVGKAHKELFGIKALASIRREQVRKSKYAPAKALAGKSGPSSGALASHRRWVSDQLPVDEKGHKAEVPHYQVILREAQKGRARPSFAEEESFRKANEEKMREGAELVREQARRATARTGDVFVKDFFLVYLVLDAENRRKNSPIVFGKNLGKTPILT